MSCFRCKSYKIVIAIKCMLAGYIYLLMSEILSNHVSEYTVKTLNIIC